MLRAIIVDDEENSSNALREKLRRHFPQVDVVSVCNSAGEGIAAIDDLKPDVVFLDIEMPKMNGFGLLQNLSYKNFELIFTTAYDHYAIKAIRFSALDYLVKPVEIDELREAISRAEEKRNQTLPNQRLELLLDNLGRRLHDRQRIALPTFNGLEFVQVDDLVYLEAVNNYTHFFLRDGRKYVASRTLKDFEELLPADAFLRIHHSYIINKACAVRYVRGEGGQVVLNNGAVLDISKRKKADFLKAFNS